MAGARQLPVPVMACRLKISVPGWPRPGEGDEMGEPCSRQVLGNHPHSVFRLVQAQLGAGSSADGFLLGRGPRLSLTSTPGLPACQLGIALGEALEVPAWPVTLCGVSRPVPGREMSPWHRPQ